MQLMATPYDPQDWQKGDLFEAEQATEMSHQVAEEETANLTQDEAIAQLQADLAELIAKAVTSYAYDIPFAFKVVFLTEEQYDALEEKDPDTLYVRPGGLEALQAASNLSDLLDVAEARTNLGLGTAALEDVETLTSDSTHAAAEKTVPVDADELPLADSEAAYALKRLTFGVAASAIIARIVDTAPLTLDTLNELAAALGDDPNFATTMTAALAGKQPLDADLTAFAALVSAANKLAYATGTGTWALTDFTAAARALLDDADAAAMRSTLGVVIGTNVQAWDVDLDTWATKTPPSGAVVGTTDTQTISGKTHTNPTITDFTETVEDLGNSGTSKTIGALSNGTIKKCTLTGNCTFTMPTPADGKSFLLRLNTGAGSFTATFTGVKWGSIGTPTATVTASRMDAFFFFSDGTNWYGTPPVQGFTP